MRVKFFTLPQLGFAGGVFIEVKDDMEYGGNDRVFRFDRDGNTEWCRYADLERDGDSARWYRFARPMSKFVVV